MIHIIYMAAGNSRRFGSNKLFYELEGKPMYRHLLECLMEIKDRYNNSENTSANKPLDYDEMDVDTVIDTYIGTDIDLSKKAEKKTKNTESNSPLVDITVVTRYREILDYCAGIPDCHAVLSPDSEKGISYTIKAGIMAVQEQKKKNGVRQKKQEKSSGVSQNSAETEEYYMFAVADQPYLKSQSVIKLIDKVLENTGNERLVFSLCCGDAVGNPCVFNSSLIPQLLSLEGDKGGRSVAKKHDCVYVDIADESELMDIDILSNSKQTGTL